MLTLLAFQLINGAIVGIFYGLMALGLSLILNLTRVINLAHGGFLVIGAYLAYTLYPFLGFWGALLAAPILTAVVGILIESSIVRRLYHRDPLDSLLLTFGLALVFEEAIRMIYGTLGMPFHVPDVLMKSLLPGTGFFFITKYRIFLILTALVCGLLLYLFMARTRVGIHMRAAVLDSETLNALGTNVSRLYTLSFGIGTLVAGLAGVLAAGQLGLTPTMGNNLIMPSFVAIIIGGVGSLLGSFVGGLLIGICSGLAGQFAPAAGEFAIYFLLALTLVIRPRGLFGQEGFLE
jgi:branched-chain amino acid transport system permease protein